MSKNDHNCKLVVSLMRDTSSSLHVKALGLFFSPDVFSFLSLGSYAALFFSSAGGSFISLQCSSFSSDYASNGCPDTFSDALASVCSALM